jgi:hypothetical protein
MPKPPPLTIKLPETRTTWIHRDPNAVAMVVPGLYLCGAREVPAFTKDDPTARIFDLSVEPDSAADERGHPATDDDDQARTCVEPDSAADVAADERRFFPSHPIADDDQALDGDAGLRWLRTNVDRLVALRDADPKSNVLLHCRGGVSRAPTLAIAFLMLVKNVSMDQAIEELQAQRPCIDPNTGFIRTLRLLERSQRALGAA